MIEHAKAEYKIINGKRFLKIRGEYKEVEIREFGGFKPFLRIMPIDNKIDSVKKLKNYNAN